MWGYGEHIVGRKVETYLTAERVWPRAWHVVRHTVVTELHATKGWRQIKHKKQTQTRTRLPSVKEWRLNNVSAFERTMPRKDPAPVNYSYDPMRHPWQRRKAAWDKLRDHYNSVIVDGTSSDLMHEVSHMVKAA